MPSRDELITFFEQGIPFHRHLCMKVVEWGEGNCELSIAPRPELTGDPFRPALHGGVISALGDAAGGFAVFSRLSAEHRASTVDLRVDYLRPARVDAPLHARARVLRMGNRVAVTETTIFQERRERPVAHVRAVYNVVRSRPRPLPMEPDEP